MPGMHEVRRLPYSAEQMFDLVADVGRYPEFLPWVAATRIRSREPGLLVADMSVGFRSFRETFTSRVTLDRPRHLHVDYVSGPLKRLSNDWTFKPADDGGTLLEFHVDFEFRSGLLEKLAGAFFHESFRRMVSSFERRAESLYGSKSLSATSAA